MKTLRQIETESTALLSPLYGDNEARSIVRRLLEEYCGIAPRDYVLEPQQTVDTAVRRVSAVVPTARRGLHAASFDEALDMCARWRPLQYVVGRAEFYDTDFYVCEGVLIPRPETYEMVDMIAREMGERIPKAKILDIGTGSGCIALSLARRLPEAKVAACDISESAAEVFAINRALLGVEAEFFAIDILSDELTENYDLIVSNPPYVLESEREAMRANVLDYEPELALFVPDSDPLRFYNRIAELATASLNLGGWLYFEINESFGAQTVAMLEAKGFSKVEACRDMFDKQRIVRAQWLNTNA